MKAIHKKRLRKLAAFLAGPVARADAKARAERGVKKFDMSHWCGWNAPDPATHPLAEPTEVGLTKALCGTSACALGWGTRVFPRALMFKNGAVVYRNGPPKGTPEDETWPGVSFFGLTHWQAEYAFLTGWRRSAKQAAAVLRALARGER